MRAHILGKEDAAWLYMTQHSIRHHGKVDSTSSNWLQRYTTLYKIVEAACPLALDRILSPEDINMILNPLPPPSQTPELITMDHLRFLPVLGDAHTMFSDKYRLFIVTDTEPQQALTVQGPGLVINNCGEQCLMGDHILVVLDELKDKTTMHRIPCDGSISKIGQLYRTATMSQLEQIPGHLQAVRVSKDLYILRTPSGVGQQDSVVWHFGVVMQSVAGDGEPMYVQLDMCSMS